MRNKTYIYKIYYFSLKLNKLKNKIFQNKL